MTKYFEAKAEVSSGWNWKEGVYINATITEGYANSVGKNIQVNLGPRPRELVKSIAERMVPVEDAHRDYTRLKLAADLLRQLASELDAKAENLPSWNRPSDQKSARADFHEVVSHGIPHGHTHTLCNSGCECFPECKT
jgi:hypothetical protein